MKTRKEVYDAIKNLHLEDEVKVTFGRNFTQVSTAELSILIEKNTKKCKKCEGDSARPEVSTFDNLVNILRKKRILLDSEVRAIYNA